MEDQSLENRSAPDAAAVFRIGRYEVLSLVGRGAFGRVVAAQDPVLNRRVAVKVITPDAPAEVRLELLERFRMEAQVLGSLTHPNIVAVYDAGFDGNMPFLAMELCDGPNLEAILEQRKVLSPVQAAWVTLQAASGVDYIHRAGIIHRDLKPSNILYHKGQFKLTDFGLARTAQMGHFTAAGQVMGTPHYMSPEQARGDQIDHRSDVYALGAILFRMLAGRPPFLGDPVAVMTQLVSRPPPRLSLVAPRLPAQLDDVLARALARIPDDRYQTGAELCAEMLKVIPRDQVFAQGDAALWLRPESAPLPPGVEPTPTGGSSMSLQPSNAAPAAGSAGATAARSARVTAAAPAAAEAADRGVDPAEREAEAEEEAGAHRRLEQVLATVVRLLKQPATTRLLGVGLAVVAFTGGLGAGHLASGVVAAMPWFSSDQSVAAMPAEGGSGVRPGGVGEIAAEAGPTGLDASSAHGGPDAVAGSSTVAAVPSANVANGTSARVSPGETSRKAGSSPSVGATSGSLTQGGGMPGSDPTGGGTRASSPAGGQPGLSTIGGAAGPYGTSAGMNTNAAQARHQVPIKLERVDPLLMDEPGWTPPPPPPEGGSGSRASQGGGKAGSRGANGAGGRGQETGWAASSPLFGGAPAKATQPVTGSSSVPTRVRVAGGTAMADFNNLQPSSAKPPALTVERADIENAANVVTYEITMQPYVRGYLVYGRWRASGGKWTSLAVLDLRDGNFAMHLVDVRGRVELEVGVVDSQGRQIPRYSRLVDMPPGR